MPRPTDSLREHKMPSPTGRKRPGATLPEAQQVIAPGRVIPNAVPEITSSRTGLEQLGAVLSGFFNQVAQAGDALREATIMKDQAQAQVNSIRQRQAMENAYKQQAVAVERENTQQSAKAQARALSGGKLTEEELQDWDYVGAYSKTLGRLHASQKSQEFAEYMYSLPPDTDLETAKNDWVSQNLLAGSETADPVYMTELLGGFESQTSRVMAEKREEVLNTHLIRGRENLQAEIVGNAMTLDPSDIPEIYERAVQLMPNDPEAARSFVTNSLLLAADGSPENTSHIINMLHAPESGDGVRSFAEMYPAQMKELEEQAVQEWENGRSWEASQTYDDIAKQIPMANTMPDLLALQDKIAETESRFGKGGMSDNLRGKVFSKIETIAQETADYNRAVAMLSGKEAFDAAHIKKWQPEIMKQSGADWKTNPQGAAEVIQRSNFVINPNTKTELESALVRGDARAVESSVQTLWAIESTTGKDPVQLGLIDASAAWEYRMARDMMVFGGKSGDDFILERSQAAGKIETVSKTSWSSIYGKSAPDANKQVIGAVDDALDDTLGLDVEVSPYIHNLIAERAKYNYVVKTPGRDPDDVIKATTKDLLASGVLQPVPGPDGKIFVEPVFVPKQVQKLGPDGSKIIGSDGRPEVEDTVPFGREVMNPGTGEPENTFEVWESDRNTLQEAIPNIEELADGDLFLSGRSDYAADGLYLVMNQDGMPLAFGLGHTYEIAGQKITIPPDITTAEEYLAEQNPFASIETKPGEIPASERFVLISRPNAHPPAFVLAYKPGFKKAPLPGIEERRKNWKPPQRMQDRKPVGEGYFPLG